MKKLKLQLNKETIARLTNSQQNSAYGGAEFTATACSKACSKPPYCPTGSNCPSGCGGDSCQCPPYQTYGNCDSATCPATSPINCPTVTYCTQPMACNTTSLNANCQELSWDVC